MVLGFAKWLAVSLRQTRELMELCTAEFASLSFYVELLQVRTDKKTP